MFRQPSRIPCLRNTPEITLGHAGTASNRSTQPGWSRTGNHGQVGNVTSGLNPYAGPLTVWDAAHLLRRVGFRVKKATPRCRDGIDAIRRCRFFSCSECAIESIANTREPLQQFRRGQQWVVLGNSWTTTNLSYATGSNDGTVNSHRQNSLIAWSWDCVSMRIRPSGKNDPFWYHFIPVNFDDAWHAE